jgi:hypothetical protein
LSALGKREMRQGRTETLAKGFDAVRQCGHIHLLLRLRLKLVQLLPQAVLGLGSLLSFALEFFAPDDLCQVDVEQASLLPFELGEGLAPVRPLQRMDNQCGGR